MHVLLFLGVHWSFPLMLPLITVYNLQGRDCDFLFICLMKSTLPFNSSGFCCLGFRWEAQWWEQQRDRCVAVPRGAHGPAEAKAEPGCSLSTFLCIQPHLWITGRAVLVHHHPQAILSTPQVYMKDNQVVTQIIFSNKMVKGKHWVCCCKHQTELTGATCKHYPTQRTTIIPTRLID